MEHRFLTEKFKFLLLSAILTLISLVFVGCKQQMADPQIIDPIYADLKKEEAAARSSEEQEKKSIEELREKLAKAEPRSIDKKRMQRELDNRQKNLSQIRQRTTYYEVRSEQRKEFDQTDYLKAFEADLPWPNPQEIAEYKKRKALMQASRNWEDRVPKNKRNLKKPPLLSASEGAKGEKPASGGEHEAPAHH